MIESSKPSRREFMVRSSALAAGAVLPLGVVGCGQAPEREQEVARTTGTREDPARHVVPETLRIETGRVEIPINDARGNPLEPFVLNTRSYNQQIPGPELRVDGGDSLEVELVNALPANPNPGACDPPDPDRELPNCFHDPNTTNLHTHGLHISPTAPSDDVLLEIPPQAGPLSRFDYLFNIWHRHPPGTHWYHPHKHGSTRLQVENGMAGALIVNDYPDTLPPEMEGIEDQVLILQELLKESDLALTEQMLRFGVTEATHLFTVNGEVRPVIEIAQGEVRRWRFVNSGVSADGYFNLAVAHLSESGEYADCAQPGAPGCVALNHIAMDGIYLDEIRQVSNVLLAPGNRADLLVRFDEPGEYVLLDLGHDRGGDFDLRAGRKESPVRAIVRVKSGGTVMLLPSRLPQPSPRDPEFLRPPQDDELTGYRELYFDVLFGPFRPMIDCKLYGKGRIDQLVSLGAVEEWTVFNRSPMDHPFHIHVNPFWVVKKNGRDVANPRWQDVVNVEGTENSGLEEGGSITFRTRFLRFAGLYVLHCHILGHEDLGMMQNVEVRHGAPLTGPPPYARAASAPPRTCELPGGD